MYLMIDVVVNHLASSTYPPTFSSFTPFTEQTQFHAQCWVDDYANQTNVEQCWLGDENVALVDVDTEDDSIVSTLNTWVKNLVSTYGADGVRIDTVKHVRKDFWPNFASSAGVYTIGEVLDNRTEYVTDYTRASFMSLFEIVIDERCRGLGRCLGLPRLVPSRRWIPDSIRKSFGFG